MKVEMYGDGGLCVTAESELEVYALKQWKKNLRIRKGKNLSQIDIYFGCFDTSMDEDIAMPMKMQEPVSNKK